MDGSSSRRSLNEIFEQTSFLYGGNAAYLTDLQARYEADPTSVDPGWRRYFCELADAPDAVNRSARAAAWRRPSEVRPESELTAALDGDWSRFEAAADGERQPATATAAPPASGNGADAARDSMRALRLIRAYRAYGHLHAKLDPLGLAPPRDHEELQASSYGFTEADHDRPIFIDGELGLGYATLRDLLARLRGVYCASTGYEFMHIADKAQRTWLQDRVEGQAHAAPLPAAEKRAILDKLVQAKGFERYLDKRYVGATRFGLDGAEAAIPALEAILRRAAAAGVTHVELGMAHRGRLNVLSQVLLKPHRAIFNEFMGGSFAPDDVENSGDVKYHLGASADREFDGRTLHLSLAANPSHLEIVDPVVLGRVRARQDQNHDTVERSTVLPLLIHGDAAFAGQGVVAESFGLSGLQGHRTGGSLHFIINNQIGFTTLADSARSSPYASDVAKMIDAPIFHVDGDDPEAVVRAAWLAIDFRQTFHKPVVIDMLCFRQYGHNEGDEPGFTQPLMYQAIRSHTSTLETYADRLLNEGVVTEAEIGQAKAEWTAHLDAEFEAGQTYKPEKADWLEGRWAGLRSSQGADDAAWRGETGVPLDRLKSIGAKLVAAPEGFQLHKTIRRFIDNRREMIETGAVDWASAEALAFATLVDEGVPVRLSGQDSERGTFSQRHAVLFDQETGARFTPLNNVRGGQARCEIVNSMLSEAAVLGFEYGYSLVEPNALVLWEAQYGDFANGAQVVFDQFISSAERKWLRMSGLVCLLPHGYDGQGSEHSSARLERYLQNSAEDNWQVANCTTPANYFHILRRQVQRDFRKPLILMTPKSLLRHRRVRSALTELAEGASFHRVLRDDAEMRAGETLKLAPDDQIRRVVLCSGKVYYDLYEERDKRGLDDIYLLRIEQLYPFPQASLIAELARFKAADVVWCQEEPGNMGAWTFVQPFIVRALATAGVTTRLPRYAGRPDDASPATGLVSQHQAQLASLLDEALG